jgi:hypothetical protein
MIETPPPPRKTSLRPSELALVAALAAMTVVAWSHPEAVPWSVRASLPTVAALFAVAALALGDERAGWRYWVRELVAVPIVPFIFLNLGTLIPLVNGRILDDVLERWDRLLMGSEVQAALYTITLPWWLTDLLTLAYSTFFFLPILLAVDLAKRRDPYLPRVVSAVVFTFLLSYTGYFVVPALGPRATVAQTRYATLPAGIVGAPLRDLLDHWEKTKSDAFPSGHTMVTLAVLYCARRRHPRLYNAILPVGALLIAATLLLTYHWLVDVLVAPPLTLLALLAARLAHGPIPPLTSASGQGATSAG